MPLTFELLECLGLALKEKIMLKISEFAVLTGIPATSLRYYDQIGLLKPEMSDPNTGYRYYAYQQLNQANRLTSLRSLGFSLEELQQIITNQLSPGQTRQVLKHRRQAIQQKMREAEQQLLVVEHLLHEIEMDGRFAQHGIKLKSLAAETVLSHRFFAPTFAQIDGLVESSRRALEAQIKEASGITHLIFYDLIYPDTNVDVEVAIPITYAMQPQAPAQIRQLAAYPLVASVFQNGREGIVRAWTELRMWIEQNGYEIVGPFQERILLESTKGTVFELLFPIEKKTGGNHELSSIRSNRHSS